MEGDLRGKKQPIGTITHRSDGQGGTKEWIKFDDQVRSPDNWMPVSVSKKARNVARRLEDKGDKIVKTKHPFSGERLMDKLLVDFYHDEMGWSKGMAQEVPGAVKKLGGWFGSDIKYSFYNYFLDIEMIAKTNAKLRKKKNKADVEMEEWKARAKKYGAGVAGERPEDYFPQYREERTISDKEFNGLEKLFDEGLKIIDRGVNFTGKQKEAYYGLLEDSKKWPERYRPFPEVMKRSQDGLKYFDKIFTGKFDWLVKENLEKSVGENFDRYFNRFKSRIIKEEGDRLSKKYGLKLKGKREDFYKKVLQIEDKLNDFEFENLMKIRFKTKLGKNLDGKWPKSTMAAIKNMEEIAKEIPKGHFLHNDSMLTVKNSDYVGGHGYAYFSPGDSSISLSDKFLSETSRKGFLADRKEFYSVVPHEIGHAVSDIYRDKINPLGYKKWVMECGWSLRQKNLQATGSDRDTLREGKNKDMPLISSYAYKSPEEAFAEYYSCYFQNKKAIDAWLDSGDIKDLRSTEKTVVSYSSFWEPNLTYGNLEEVKKPFIRRKKSIYYRDHSISEDIIKRNKELFRFMRYAIFGSEKLNKAIKDFILQKNE